ncbi:MAG TPA: ABC transporter ATP-binding protein [Gemmata sp.]|jgi:ABC-type Fe3+/spermidine/putrescine transport system ATPase subunit|nr:ABC transporter ATP-binding protein [Gemmata sp.]
MKGTRFEVRSLSKCYGEHRALCDVSFIVEAGENLAILGPSGSGKSTVLRLLAGLEAPDSGQVLLNDRHVSGPGQIILAPHRRGISMVFQDLALWPNLSAHDNVLMGLSGLSLSRPEALARTREALSLCGVEELAHRKPGAMSGGQQQRIALARAIAVRPAFLLMDEPYAGLDLVIKSRLLAEVHALTALQKMTVILVTHDPWEAMSLCRSALVLDQGCLVEAGPLTELLREPRSDLLCIFRDEFRRHEPKPKPAAEESEELSRAAFSTSCLPS